MKKIVLGANKGGRVTIISSGQEYLPKKDGFVIYPNHQGLYDVLAFIESIDRPFSVVAKQEVKDIPFLKQVFAIMKAIPLDRQDVKQAMKVIMEVTERVKAGENFLIFAEGTRSRNGNELLNFKGGSFKAAMKAKAPIVPVAIIDSFKPFDRSSIEKVNVQIHYLEPLYYEDYKEMKSTEIAVLVKEKIEAKIKENI